MLSKDDRQCSQCVPEDPTHIPSFYPRGSKMRLFLLYGNPIPRYRQTFKVPICGHETWQMAKVPHIISFYPKGSKLSLFLLFRDTGQFSKLPYLGMKLGKWPKFLKLHIYPLSTPGGRN